MEEVTLILTAVEQGEPHAAERLLDLVYSELRQLAAQKLAREKPGQTLDATALVHEAYVRLFGREGQQQHWDNQGHFFAAAAEAMRRILIDNARRKKRQKRGGGRERVALLDEDLAIHDDAPNELLTLDEAMAKLAVVDSAAAQVVKIRLFTGLSIEKAAEALGISRATAYRHWSYARAWLRCEMRSE